jgi:hypothetical protein
LIKELPSYYLIIKIAKSEKAIILSGNKERKEI